MGFSVADIPPQDGRTFLITGANSGLGYESARALARRGAVVWMACRNVQKAEAAAGRIRAEVPEARLELLTLDLGDLESVRRCAEDVAGRGGVDVLLNNAGIMAVPQGQTRDGFEIQLGTNHLGHFALTGRLLPHIRDRVVQVASAAAYVGWMNFDNLQWEQGGYNRWLAYGRSKLANLLFFLELSRRFAAAGRPQRAIGAHPGYAATELQGTSAAQSGAWLEGGLMALGNRLTAQSAASGALPQLYAATAADAENGAYFGPQILGLWGAPRRETPSAPARDEAHGRRLWEVSEALTGVKFGI